MPSLVSINLRITQKRIIVKKVQMETLNFLKTLSDVLTLRCIMKHLFFTKI